MDAQSWNDFIAQLPRPHILQSWQWAQAKKSFGWSAEQRRWTSDDGKAVAAAQILERSIKLPILKKTFKMLYVPKGPLLADWSDSKLRERVLNDLKEIALERDAIFIKIDPDLAYGYGLAEESNGSENQAASDFVNQMRAKGWRFSNEQIQMKNTMLIDLGKSEDELLAAMKQKTRYNVRLAARKGVSVRVGDASDFEKLYQMYAETSVRDGFAIRSQDYYQEVWQTFIDSNMMKALIAEVDGEIVAGLMLFIFAEQAWYIYGMSRNLHRDKMPNYLLQWEAIKEAKAAGCEVYDLWGAPDDFNSSDPMWGVYRFKKGLAAIEARHIGAWDLPIKKLAYRLYIQVLPRIISLMRWRGKRNVRSQVNTGFDG